MKRGEKKPLLGVSPKKATTLKETKSTEKQQLITELISEKRGINPIYTYAIYIYRIPTEDRGTGVDTP